MIWLEEFIGSGAITLIILAILAGETLAYMFYFKRMRPMLPTLAAGACLVLALRTALLHHSTIELAVFLALGFIFHILEVWQWLQKSKTQPQ